MTLGEKIKEHRTRARLSQESIAGMIGVSRQAVTKWEADQTVPSSDNLISLAKIFQIPLDELVMNNIDTQGKKPNMILQANLTRIAIIAQVAMLHAYATIYYNVKSELINPDNVQQARSLLLFSLFPILLCSVWMASNHRFEKDLQQRKKNTRIELTYCFIQLAIAFLTMRYGMGLVGAMLALVIALVYILVINPKYMKRELVKQKTGKVENKNKTTTANW